MTNNRKIVVVIEGGVTVGVFSDDPNIKVEIIDVDNMKSDGQGLHERDTILANRTSKLHVIYP